MERSPQTIYGVSVCPRRPFVAQHLPFTIPVHFGMLDRMDKEPTNAELLKHIDTLAEAVAAGFSEVHKKFDEVHEKFDAVDKRFDSVEERLDRIENTHVRRLENLELAHVDFRRDITKLKEHAGIE
jgi:hypothetical protein